MRVYTGRGDDGTTGLLGGGRVGKDTAAPAACGAVDEAQAALGLARAEVEPGSELDGVLLGVERDLYVVMAELATAPGHRHRLVPGQSLVTGEMITALEGLADDVAARTALPDHFVLPGQNRLSSLLDLARTVVRRAERATVAAAAEGSSVLAYLNRLSSLVWVLARAEEGERVLARDHTGLVGPSR
ncbi:MAG: cob(I)yrinic acid a,c-diamide adenosyltransferase [Acidimicrobiales bacterium]